VGSVQLVISVPAVTQSAAMDDASVSLDTSSETDTAVGN